MTQPAIGDLVGSFMLQDVHFFDPETGLAIGQLQYYGASMGGVFRTSSGLIVTTEDGGENWQVKQVPTNALTSLCYVDDIGWAVGNNGTILRTIEE